MTPAPHRTALLVPLERLQRRDPERHWTVEVSTEAIRDDDVGPLRVADVSVRDDAPIRVELELVTVTEGVMVSGTVESQWTGPCSRCLRDLDGSTRAEVQELFESTPTEGESYPLGDELLDLTPLVRDAVLLELPLLAPCPEPDPCPYAPDELVAGDDAEDDEDPPGDPRWAALSELRFDD